MSYLNKNLHHHARGHGLLVYSLIHLNVHSSIDISQSNDISSVSHVKISVEDDGGISYSTRKSMRLTEKRAENNRDSSNTIVEKNHKVSTPNTVNGKTMTSTSPG